MVALCHSDRPAMRPLSTHRCKFLRPLHLIEPVPQKHGIMSFDQPNLPTLLREIVSLVNG